MNGHGTNDRPISLFSRSTKVFYTLLVDIALICIMVMVAGTLFRKPLRHRILYWPTGLSLAYESCILGAHLLAPVFKPGSSFYRLFDFGLGLLWLILTVLIALRPSKILYFATAALCVSIQTHYIVVFLASTNGAPLNLILSLLHRPIWIMVLLSQIALAALSMTLARIAISKPDVFKRETAFERAGLF